MNPQTKATLRSITTVFVVVAVIFALLIFGLRIFGFQIYGVLTGSMEPTYQTGSLIYTREVNPADLKLRDVITFNSGKTVVTHRIVDIRGDRNDPYNLEFQTKGDANKDPDANWVKPAAIIGRVSFGIPHLGNIAKYIQTPPGLYVAIVIGIVMVALVIITDGADKKDDNNAQQQKKPAPKFVRNIASKLGIKPKQQPAASPMKQGYVPQQQAAPQQYTAQQYAQAQQYTAQQYAQQQYAAQQYAQQQQYAAQQYAQQQQYAAQQYAQQQQQYPQQYAQQQYPQQYAAPQYQQYPQQQYAVPQYQQYPQGVQYPQQQQTPPRQNG